MKTVIKRIFSFSIVLLAGSLLIESCDEDLLDQVNPNESPEATFWQTAEDAKKGIIGAYAPLVDISSYNRFRIFFTDYRSDVIFPNGSSGRATPAFFQGDSNLGGVGWMWRDSYKGIYRANNVLANVPSIQMDENQKNAILGEAYFIRAFNYFDLIVNFLNIPIVLTPLDGLDATTVFQAPPEQVWDLIISDLELAETLLPKSWPETDKGRAIKASAQAYLGKAHLYKADLLNSNEDYGKAATIFNRLISENPGISLMDDYADNFKEETENNKESIFEIQFFNDGNTGWGPDNASSRKTNNFTEDIAPREPGGFSGQDGMTINQWVLDLFLDERTINNELDPRVYSTIMFDSNEETNYKGKVLKSTYYEGKTYAEAFGGSNLGVFGKKHLEVDKAGRQKASFNQSGNNLRIMRLADVYLMLAEAEFKSNGNTANAAAVNAINIVRNRADMPEFTTSMTMQDIMDERVKELTLEWSRYYDLLRWGLVKERIVDTPGIKSNVSSYAPGREYLNIPTGELGIYQNLVPNPGY